MQDLEDLFGTPQNVDDLVESLMRIPASKMRELAPRVICDYINNRMSGPVLLAGENAEVVNALYNTEVALKKRREQPVSNGR